MRVRVLYEADGMQSMYIEGPVISTQVMPDGRGMVVVRSAGGEELRVVQFVRVHYMDKT